MSTTARTTYRESDGSPVQFADALRAWTRVGYDYLLETATQYNATITYKDMAEQVQAITGIRTSTTTAHLVNKVLELCAIQAASNGEPPLTSLCVHADGTVGNAYWRTPTAENVELPTVAADSDVEMHAAEHRLLCYRKYSPLVPADGGTPTLPERLTLKRERAERSAEKKRIAAQEDAPRPVCPTCFTQLPTTGVCWHCE